MRSVGNESVILPVSRSAIVVDSLFMKIHAFQHCVSEKEEMIGNGNNRELL